MSRKSKHRRTGPPARRASPAKPPPPPNATTASASTPADAVDAPPPTPISTPSEPQPAEVEADGVVVEELEGRYAALVERERRVREREIEAENGFAGLNEQALAELETRRDSLAEEVAQLLGELSTQRSKALAELESELDERRRAQEQDLEKRRDALATEDTRITALRESHEAERRSLADVRFDLEMEREDVGQERAQLEERVTRSVARERSALETRIAALMARHDAANESLEVLQARLQEAERRQLAFGGKTADEIVAELDDYRKRVASLEAERTTNGDDDSKEQVSALRNECDALREKNRDLIRSEGEARATLARLRADLGERDLLGARVQAAERHRDVLLNEVNLLSDRFDALLAKDRDQTPFALLSAIDARESDQRPYVPPSAIVAPDLEALITHVRTWLATRPKRLYYRDRDLRLFLAGLAASRLHVLEGISGTGKTTLPRAFAQAVGGKAEVVEVQAGWRDREDLLGHFNTFEGRYSETRFIEALYRAQSPAWEDVPFFVVLDEMNLSHPEQYFADLLSLLERDGDDHLLLTTQPLPSAPRLITAGGIRVPPNVWFIGTANHDETTMLFADKTYDRSHVMTLPDKPVEEKAEEPAGPAHTSNTWLQTMFERARKDGRTEAAQVWDWLDANLRATFSDEFDVGWGPRLEQQLAAFVPVVLAAGGDLGEAADHVIATKLLRKVRDRHDVGYDQLRQLGVQIESSWQSLKATTGPVSTMALLQRERRKKGDTQP